MKISPKILIVFIFLLTLQHLVLPCSAKNKDNYILPEEIQNDIDKNELFEARKRVSYIFKKRIKYLYSSAYDMRGQINYKEGKYKAAIRDYKKALKFDSKDYIAYVGIGDKDFDDIDSTTIKEFYLYCEKQNLTPIRFKNTMALLKQILKYAKDNGFTKNNFDFQVKRLSAKNEFNINQILFKQGVYQCF